MGERLAFAVFLLSLAASGCGGGDDDPAPANPDGEARPEGSAWFVESAEARGLVFRHESGHAGRYLYPEIIGGGAALFDVEGDGDLDAYLVQSGSLVEPASSEGNRLFVNDGAGRFSDATAGSGASDRGYGMGAAVGDCDGDGDTDLYLTNLGENVLLSNAGGGRFEPVTEASGVGESLWSTSAAFFDPDRDGDLDLFCVNYLFWSLGNERVCYVKPLGETYCGPRAYDSPSPDTLYENRGDGTFANVSAKAGLLRAFGNGLGIACADFDVDGRPDVFVANDGNLDQLWIQTEEPLVFEDRATAFGCGADMDGRIKAGMGVGICDLDDDGDEDLLVVNLDSEPDSLFLNQRTHFVDRTAAFGIKGTTQAFTRFGVGFPDLDNDGIPDLFLANGRVALRAETWGDDPLAEPNLLLRGTRPGGRLAFEELLPRGGTREPLIATSRAACFGDVDADGGVDVLVVNKDAPAHLLLNRVADRGDWVRLRAVGESGADAIGAVLEIPLGERSLTRTVRSGYSYLAASDLGVHVGLGQAPLTGPVVVRWPDGGAEVFEVSGGGRTWVLRRGEGAPR